MCIDLELFATPTPLHPFTTEIVKHGLEPPAGKLSKKATKQDAGDHLPTETPIWTAIHTSNHFHRR